MFMNKSVEQMIQLLSHEDHPLFHSWMADLICMELSSYTSYNELFKVKAICNGVRNHYQVHLFSPIVHCNDMHNLCPLSS